MEGACPPKRKHTRARRARHGIIPMDVPLTTRLQHPQAKVAVKEITPEADGRMAAAVSLCDAPLAAAASTLYHRALKVYPVNSVALFRIREGDAPELVATAGRASRNAIKRLTQAAESTIHSGRPDPHAPVLCYPVAYGESLWGIVAFGRKAGHDGEGSEILRELTQLEIENALLRTRRRADEERLSPGNQGLAALYEIGQAIHSLSSTELLDLICEKAAGVMQAQACSLMLKSQESELVIRASFGLQPDIVRDTRIPQGHGIAWHVAASGQPVLLNESPSQQIGDLSIPHRQDIQSSMCVPLRGRDGRILGVLSIRRMVPAPEFDAEDLRLFSLFADQAALSIDNANLYSSLNRRVEEMATLNRVTAAINSALDLDYVLGQIADCIVGVVRFDRCIVYLTDYNYEHLESAAVRGFDDGSYPRTIDRLDSVVGLAAREQIVIFAEGDLASTASPVSAPEAAGPHAVIAAPIVVRKQTIGVIVADNRNTGRPVEHSQVELLSAFVNHAGLAIENSRLYEAMEQKYSELNVLYEQSRTIGSAYGLDNAVELLLQVAGKAVPYSSAALALVDEAQLHADVYATRHTDPESPAPWQVVENSKASGLIAGLRDPRMVLPLAEGETPTDWQAALDPLLGAGCEILLTPLIADGRTIAVLMLLRSDGTSFNASNVKLLSIIGSHASVVIKNAATYERNMQEKVLELSALYRLSQRISTAGSLTEALESILAIVSDLVPCDKCRIWTVNQDSGELDLRASRPADTGTDQGPSASVEAALAEWAARERKAVVLPEVQQDSQFWTEELKDTALRSFMSIPLMVQDDVAGVLTVQNYRPNVYTEEQVRILSVVASQAASVYRGLEALTALTTYTDNILTSVAAGVVTLDAEGAIVSWNRAAEDILGMTSRHVLGQGFFDALQGSLFSPADRRRLAEAVSDVVDSGLPRRGVEVSVTTKDERQIHLTLGVSQLKNNENEPLGLVIIFEDVTLQVHMQEEVRRMGELAAIGQLAASIAHELRNPLSSIKGAAQFLQQETGDPSTREFLGIILEEVDGLNKIASDFLDFARPLRVDVTEVKLADVLHRQLALLGQQLEEAEIDTDVSVDEVPSVRADQKQIEQVLLNLILNSVQAMPTGGRLSLTVTNSRRWTGHVELAVGDTGTGIPSSRLAKIFTPFFTTKIKGTGLGLPVVQKIVQNHHGHIEVDSTEGEGATFRIHLPIEGPRPSLLSRAFDSPPDLLERT